MKTKRSKSYFLSDLNIHKFKDIINSERKSALIPPQIIEAKPLKSSTSTYWKLPTKRNLSQSILENQQIEKLKQKYERNWLDKAYYFSTTIKPFV